MMDQQEHVAQARSISDIKGVRDALGCSLREAVEFYDNNLDDPVGKANQRAAENLGDYSESPLEKIRAAITGYYKALDRREHGGVAQLKAFNAIQKVLGMSWVAGATLPKPAEVRARATELISAIAGPSR